MSKAQEKNQQSTQQVENKPVTETKPQEQNKTSEEQKPATPKQTIDPNKKAKLNLGNKNKGKAKNIAMAFRNIYKNQEIQEIVNQHIKEC